MEVKDRIKLLMDTQKMSQQEFAQVLGITPGSLSGILNERTRPTNNHTLAIHKAFPNVSINWLLFGEGEMYATPKNDDQQASQNFSSEDENPSLFSSPVETSGFTLSAPPRSVDFPTEVKPVFQPASKVQEEAPKIVKRQIKEIRVFYDDGTYETFAPSN